MTSTELPPEQCARCKKATPREDDRSTWALEWEATSDGAGWICPECINPDERQEIDELGMDLLERQREKELRKLAARHGLSLKKSPNAVPGLAYGTYMLVDERNTVVAKGLESGYGMSLDDVEEFLRELGR